MNFDSNQIYLFLALAFSLFISSAYFQFKLKKTNTALAMLIIAAAVIRLGYIFIDPYLGDWDERFHALVAKHMMLEPFKPMLRLKPILPYVVSDWCCNHVWVHKQPLFMWQMALSMKLFGINLIALRLPSVIMSTVMVYFIYDIAKMWTRNQQIAFIAAFLFALNFKFLEMLNGHAALDHNDMAFTFYVTASIWAFSKYEFNRQYKWAIIIGLLVGCAILNKWLIGLLLYAGWGITLISYKEERTKAKNYLDLLLSVAVSCFVFLPWQIYINSAFPAETAASYKHNLDHITSDLGHFGTYWYYFTSAIEIYNHNGLFFIAIGMFWMIKNRQFVRRFNLAFMIILAIIYLFFSLLVKTKMEGFALPVVSIIFSLMGIGIYYSFAFIPSNDNKRSLGLLIFVTLLGFTQLAPYRIVSKRELNAHLDHKIHNTKIFHQLDENQLNEYYIFNAKIFEEIEIMFFKDLNVYQYCPSDPTVIDSLIEKGYKIAMFDYPIQQVPEHYKNNPKIKIIPIDFR